MQKNQNLNTRNQKQLNKRKKKSQPFSLKLGFSLFFFGLFLFSGIYVMQSIENKQLQERIKEQEILVFSQIEQEKKDVAPQKEVSQTKNLTTVIYQPTADNPFQVPTFERLAQKALKEAKKELKTRKSTLLVSYLAINHHTEALADYQIAIEVYQWQKRPEKFKKIKTTTTRPIFMNLATGQPVTSQELIKEEANLLGIQQVIQQTLLDEAKEPNQVIDEVLNLPRLTWETKMRYQEDYLAVQLPKNQLGQAEIILPYAKIQPFIQTNLVKPDKLANTVSTIDPKKKYVALTFDDGPLPATTAKIIQTLAKKDVKATFFLLGQNAKAYPALVKQIYEAGHELASHSYSHPSLKKLAQEAIKKEVLATDKAIFEATGQLPKTLRPPYGAINADVAKIVGKPIVQWSVDSFDWKSKDPSAIQKIIQKTVTSGSIILMHDVQPATAKALEKVIDSLIKQGYQFVTVQELLEHNLHPLQQYFSQFDQRPT